MRDNSIESADLDVCACVNKINAQMLLATLAIRLVIAELLGGATVTKLPAREIIESYSMSM